MIKNKNIEVSQNKIEYLNSKIDALFDTIIIGSGDSKNDFQKIVQNWKDNITEAGEFKSVPLNIYIKELSKASTIFLKNNTNKDNSVTLFLLKDRIQKVILSDLQKDVLPNIYIKPEIKGDKDNALKLAQELKDDFNFKDLIINLPGNWDHLSFWITNTKKSLNRYIKDFKLPKEAISLNGELSLYYISKRKDYLEKLAGFLYEHEESGNGLVLGLSTDRKNKNFNNIVHEYTHVFDRIGSKKYYEAYPEKLESRGNYEKSRNLSEILVMEALQGNTFSDNYFLKELQKSIFQMVSVDPVEDAALNYKKTLSSIFEHLREPFISSLFGKLKNKINEDKLKSWADEQIEFFCEEGIPQINNNIELIFTLPSILDNTAKKFDLNKEEIEYIKTNKEEFKNNFGKSLKEVLVSSNFFSVNNTLLGKKGMFGTSPYMEKLIKHLHKNERNKNITFYYWTSICEVFARHVGEVPKYKHQYPEIMKPLYPKLNASEKKECIKLIQDLVQYSQTIN